MKCEALMLENCPFQMMRVTELQSVIAELTRKLNEVTGNKIIEEDEDAAESQCSSDLEAEEGRQTQSCNFTFIMYSIFSRQSAKMETEPPGNHTNPCSHICGDESAGDVTTTEIEKFNF